MFVSAFIVCVVELEMGQTVTTPLTLTLDHLVLSSLGMDECVIMLFNPGYTMVPTQRALSTPDAYVFPQHNHSRGEGV